MDDRERFWSKVDKGEEDECWEWLAGCRGDGYGAFWYQGSQKAAHRMVYIFSEEEVGNQWVLHHCDNKTCVNPSHLYLGDRQDNTEDAIERDRAGAITRGEGSPHAKLQRDQVEDIRDKYDGEDVILEDLADEYNVTISAIDRIVRGETW